MHTLKYVFGYLRQKALIGVSMILAAMSRLGLVSPLILRVLAAASGVLTGEKALIVNSKLSFEFHALFG